MRRGAGQACALAIVLLWGSAGATLAAAVVSSPGDRELSRIALARATLLVELGRFCMDEGLHNDAERILLTAMRIDRDAADFDALDTELTNLRIAVARGEGRATRKSFVLSDAYDRARNELQKEEEALTQRITERLLDLAAKLKSHPHSEARDRALWEAFLLDPQSRRLCKSAGPQVLDTLEERLLKETGLARLELGKVVDDQNAELADLRGKVVVWRSVSL